MSTNTHEQSKTCTDIVNGTAWFHEATTSLRHALADARHAGGRFLTVQHWARADDDARRSEGETIGVLMRAAQALDVPAGPARHPGAAAAVATLQGLGWTYNAPASSWERPPAPAGGEVPGGGLPDWPVGVQTFHERAAYQRGVADGRRVGALRDAAEAVISARYQGLLTVLMDKALGALVDALGGPPRPAFPPAWDAEECRNAALEVLRLAPDPLHRDSRFGEALRRLAAVQRVQ